MRWRGTCEPRSSDGDRVTDEELSPFLIRGHAIRKETKVTLDDPCPPFGLRRVRGRSRRVLKAGACTHSRTPPGLAA